MKLFIKLLTLFIIELMNVLTTILLPFIKQNIIIFIFLFLTSIGFTIDGIVSPFYLSKLTFANKSQQSKYLIYLISSFLFGSLLIYFYRKLRIQFYAKIQPFFISQKINHLLSKNEKQYQTEPDTNVFNNILHNAQIIEYIFTNLYELIPFIIFFIVYLYIIFDKSKLNFMMVTITFLLIMIINFKYVAKDLITKGILLSQSRNNLIHQLDNKHQNIIDLTSFNTIDKEQVKLQKKTEQFGNTIQKLLTNKYIYEQTSYSLVIISSIIILYLFYKNINVISKQYYCFIILITFTYFYMFQRNYYNLTTIISYYAELKKFTQLLKNYTDINYNEIHKFSQYYQINNNKQNKDIFIIRNLSFKYQQKTILNHIHLTIPQDKVTCIIGKIGSGKSTLLKLLFGIYQPHNGKIIMNIDNKLLSQGRSPYTLPQRTTSSFLMPLFFKKGKKVLTKDNNTNNNNNKKIDIREWRKYIHYVPQFTEVFNKKMSYNLNYGKTQYTNNYKNNYPNFIKKILSRNDNNLSGGQKQIITLYRLLNNPKPIILLDEPTSALDKGNKKYLFYILDKLKKNGSTIIIVSHDKEMMNYCNHIINLSQI